MGSFPRAYIDPNKPKCPRYGGVRIKEVGIVRISVSLQHRELSVIERCPYYGGGGKERFNCIIEWFSIECRK